MGLFFWYQTDATIRISPNYAFVPWGEKFQMNCASMDNSSGIFAWVHTGYAPSSKYLDGERSNQSTLYFLNFTEPNQGGYTCRRWTEKRRDAEATAFVLLEILPKACDCEVTRSEHHVSTVCRFPHLRTESFPQWQINSETLSRNDSHSFRHINGNEGSFYQSQFSKRPETIAMTYRTIRNQGRLDYTGR